jgi:hypothetical protein
MNRLMCDAVNLELVPQTPRCDIIGFYLNGPDAVPDIPYVTNLFPYARQNPIDVNGGRPDYARTLDVELYDATPDDCEPWITEYNNHSVWHASGGRPVIYCNLATVPAVRNGTGKYVLGRDYYLWVAEWAVAYTGPTVGVVAWQHSSFVNKYDVSEVFSPRWLPAAA